MSNLLEAIDLKKTYVSGDVNVEALRGVSLRVEAGEMVAVMGPSGCGKSSLMHILGAMTHATSGTVLIDGRNIADMGDRARTDFRRDKVGFVFQKFNLLPTLSARMNIELARRIHGSHGAETEDRMREVLELLQIQDKMDRRPAELSGGEQQRVAIARAVVKHPAIILADEPTGNLDSNNSKIVLDMFKELNRRLGQTIILVTHNPGLTAYTDRVIEMLDGKIVRDGSRNPSREPEVASQTASVDHS
jgi:putative ABC transport system ATP-binding protein